MVQTKEGSVLYGCTKFEADSSIRSKVIRGSQNFEIGSRDPGHVHLVLFYGPHAGGTVLHLCTKFEVDCSIRSKVIRGSQNFKIGHVTQATPS